jgi:RNase H-fold protein (predicted Holliday junction resolvase)
MNTNVKDNGKAVNNSIVKTDKKEQFVAGNPVNKESAKPEAEKPKEETSAAKTEQPKTEAPKTEQSKPQIAIPQAEPKAEPKMETPKAEPQGTAVKDEPKKVVLNLEGTLKFIEEMHRKAKQRNKLQETIKNLDEFEVELRDEADTTDTNYYNGCVLTIEDDNRRKFETKNPTIIWTVAQLVNNMCVDKLAEIEASIVIPQ